MKTTYIVTLSTGETVSRSTRREYTAAVEAVDLQGARGLIHWCGTVGLAQKAAAQLRKWGFTEIQIHPVSVA
jgi:hypothetical protein